MVRSYVVVHKGTGIFIKKDMPRYINTTRGEVQAFESFMGPTISKKNIFSKFSLQFARGKE